MSSVDSIKNINIKRHEDMFSFFVYQTFYKDDSQLCYNRIIFFSFCEVCVKWPHVGFLIIYNVSIN